LKNAQPIVCVIIPAFNEAKAIGHVINEIPPLVDEIIVVNNGSTDDTHDVASKAGATVLAENRRGYGYACLKGIEYLNNRNQRPDIIVFLDGDHSDYPQELTEIIAPIINSNMDLVIGNRAKELREAGSLTPQQVFGNWLACWLMKILYRATYTDLGPFRAIRFDQLNRLQMTDKTYGWTIEMQLKALRLHLNYCEVPVSYKKRIGVSKVSGTLKGAIFAGIKIISWILKHGVH
jgi:glycosyltransferase involved in cell wall biosynthesis